MPAVQAHVERRGVAVGERLEVGAVWVGADVAGDDLHPIQRGPRAAALRHHPSQYRPDLRICPRPGVAGILYAGPYGRVVAVSGHTSGNPARPPRISPL